jgi:hypothetical protein
VYYDVLDHQCIDGHVKCADGIQCIGEWEMCNGDTKCNDESDEIPDVCKGNKRLANQKYAKHIKSLTNFIT